MIASVVITLCDDAERQSKTIDQINSSPHIEIGAYTRKSRRIPAVIETANREEIETVTRWLQGLSNVTFVDVVYVHFEETTTNLG